MTSGPKLPALFSLTPSQIEEVKRDVDLMMKGAQLFYCVDTHDIVRYCFPLDPTSPSPPDVDSIADEQVALYEVFEGRQTRRALLLPDYESELRGHLEYLQSSADEAHSSVEMLSAFIRDAKLQPPEVGTAADKLLPLVRDDFNVLLAIVLGIYSLGLDRLLRTVQRLERFEDFGDPLVTEVNGSYRPTSLERTIYASIVDSIPQLRPTEQFRKRRSARRDARAIDRLLYVNASLAHAYEVGKTKNLTQFLYLSSAPRTREIFDLDAVTRAAAKIDDRPYPVWRHHSQVFAMLVARGLASSGTAGSSPELAILDDLKNTVTSLATVRRGLSHSGPQCERCLLEGGTADGCIFYEVCSGAKKLVHSIEDRRSIVDNLGLITAIRNYWHFKTPASGLFQDYVDVLQAACRDEDLNNLILHDMRTHQFFISVGTILSDSLSSSCDVSGPRMLLKHDRDVITSAALYLPLAPRIESDLYQDIVDNIVHYYKLSSGGSVDEQLRCFDKAYTEFLRLEVKQTDIRAEHELTRCLLYLGFPGRSGDQEAYRHATEMLKRYAGEEQEFLYILVWATRRLGKFEEGIAIADRAITAYPADPRLYHGRALLNLAWFRDPKHGSSWNLSGEAAIDDLQNAIQKYYEQDRDRYRILIGAAHGNMAYVQCIGSQKSSWGVFDVARARKDLELLKRYIPRSEWRPTYPEYFHLEALVLFNEYCQAKSEGRPDYRESLNASNEANETAISIFDKRVFIDLRKRILEAFKSEGVAVR